MTARPAPPTHLHSTRLLLRPAGADDVTAVYEYGSDAEVARYMDWPRHEDITTAQWFVAYCASAWADGSEYAWMLAPRAQPHNAIGCISVRMRGDDADFGYVLSRRAWGQGLATEAGHAVFTWLCAAPGMKRIWATCDADNTASARVLTKLGLTLVRRQKQATRRPNFGSRWRDNLLFEMTLPAVIGSTEPDRR